MPTPRAAMFRQPRLQVCSWAVLMPLLGAVLFHASAVAAEWNQWRGAARNGVCDDGIPLLKTLPESGLPILWQSDPIPSDHDGGHGSPVVADGRVYLGLVWHTSVPSVQRVIEEDHLVSLGYRDTSLLGEKLTAELEQTRKSLPASLRGEALNEKNRQWVKDHFNEEQRLILGSWAEWRLGQKASAADLEVLNRIHPRVNQPFASHEALVQWFNEIQVPDSVQERLLKAIPATVKEAQDVVLCLDLATGKTLWKSATPGVATGRMASSTCTVVDGVVYALGSSHLEALHAATGEVKWRKKLTTPPNGSSPLVQDGRIYIMAGQAMCYSAADGSLIWQNQEAKGGHASPVLWAPPRGRPAVVFPTASSLVGLDGQKGRMLWEIPGGGPSTPVVSANQHYLVMFSDAKDTGLQCFTYETPDGRARPYRVWHHWWLASRHSASPLISAEHVYLMEGGRHLCLGLRDGKVRWEETVESTISSPVLADGRIWTLEQNGLFLRAVQADPTAYHLDGRVKVEALWCPTPLFAQGRLILRTKDRLVCLDIRK